MHFSREYGSVTPKHTQEGRLQRHRRRVGLWVGEQVPESLSVMSGVRVLAENI